MEAVAVLTLLRASLLHTWSPHWRQGLVPCCVPDQSCLVRVGLKYLLTCLGTSEGRRAWREGGTKCGRERGGECGREERGERREGKVKPTHAHTHTCTVHTHMYTHTHTLVHTGGTSFPEWLRVKGSVKTIWQLWTSCVSLL